MSKEQSGKQPAANLFSRASVAVSPARIRSPEPGDSDGSATAAGRAQKPLPGNVVPLLPREKKASKTKKVKTIKRARSLGSKTADTEADWIKSLLPVPESGWWDVRQEDKGFVIKFRWRAAGEQPNQTFPRISREQFQKLKEMERNECIAELRDRIAGHLDDLRFDPKRRERARLVAERIGIGSENYRDAAAPDYAG
ncbi:MAG: hypothetical protein L0220_12220 [Acidobacteria bacterium]|nr:hypothetical protein [Acidobacteriota bacterium]